MFLAQYQPSVSFPLGSTNQEAPPAWEQPAQPVGAEMLLFRLFLSALLFCPSFFNALYTYVMTIVMFVEHYPGF